MLILRQVLPEGAISKFVVLVNAASFDPLNSSVGTYVDGIDFTGFGGAATLLDIEQVEVLRGSSGYQIWCQRIGRCY